MGIKERQERDREAVRRAILDAARELFVAEGFRNVSIRKIAERIEYSPAAIYSYFPSKDDIFFALAEEGFRLLGHPGVEGRREVLEGLDPIQRIRAVFWRVYEFSRQHPEYFALMFLDRSVPRISREYERFAFARETKRHVVAELERCVKAKVFPPTVKPTVAMRVLIAGLLGIAALKLSDRLAPGEDPDLLASDVLDTAIAGLRAGVVLKSAEVDLACPATDPLVDQQAS
jgi:AcrR family transcriptional regulator